MSQTWSEDGSGDYQGRLPSGGAKLSLQGKK